MTKQPTFRCHGSRAKMPVAPGDFSGELRGSSQMRARVTCPACGKQFWSTGNYKTYIVRVPDHNEPKRS